LERKFTVKLSTLVDEFNLEKVYTPPDYEQVLVTTASTNRPGMQLIGFFNHFSNERLQIMGTVECMYLKTLPANERRKCFEMLIKRGIPALIICNNMMIYPECLEMAQKYEVTLLKTSLETSIFEAELITSLNVHLAPRITRHGVMVEVYGEGILLLGESGIGKSETAVELVKRGHRLIADDAVEIRKISYNTLIGSAPEIIRHYIELRGIGVVDVRRLFGMGSVKTEERLDLIINIEPWQEGMMYDRLGLEDNYTSVLGIKVPSLTVPVKPGRNTAIIIEVAAMNNREKKMGYNVAREFTQRINSQFDQKIGID